MLILEKLIQIKDLHEAALFQMSGVHSVGIGKKTVAGKETDDFAIVVFVIQKRELATLRAEDIVPALLEGIPTDVIEHPGFELAAFVRSMASVDNRAQRPLVGGCAVSADPAPYTPPPGSTLVGTLGGFASTNNDPPMFQFSVGVSNNHVLGQHTEPHRVNVLQPANGPRVSQVTMSVYDPDLGVDAAGFSGLVNGINYNATVLDLGTVTGSYDVGLSDVGKTVFKRGITTALTQGVLKVLDQGVQLTNPFTNQPVVFKHQMFIEGAFADHGDSGSFILLPDPAGPGLYLVIGLLMAKGLGDGPVSGAANQIGIVQRALGITFPAPPLT